MQQEDVNDFFRPIHSQMEIPDGDYDKTAICIAMATRWPAIQITACIS